VCAAARSGLRVLLRNQLGVVLDESGPFCRNLTQGLQAGERFGVLSDLVVDYPRAQVRTELSIALFPLRMLFNGDDDIFDDIFAIG
jgi:hypothetical protein